MCATSKFRKANKMLLLKNNQKQTNKKTHLITNKTKTKPYHCFALGCQTIMQRGPGAGSTQRWGI